MTKSVLDRVDRKMFEKAEQLNKLTGLPRTKVYGAIGSITPTIIDSKIIPAKNGHKKRIKLLMVQEYEI